MAKCAREQLQENFYEWLNQEYSQAGLELIDISLEAARWVTEQGEFIPGTGQAIFEICQICRQAPTVLDNGKIVQLASEPSCKLSPEPGIVPIELFNKSQGE